jgi:hypothetical protein
MLSDYIQFSIELIEIQTDDRDSLLDAVKKTIVDSDDLIELITASFKSCCS